MAHVLIVSNRLPVSVKKQDGKLVFSESIGGLATGLSSYVKDRRNKWIGWPGIASDELTDREKQQIVKELAKHHCSPVFLTKKQIDEYYNGYSNAVLWPLFHNLPLSDTAEPARTKWWKAYRSVNKAFCDAVSANIEPNSRIWVHDYQLLLLPDMIRRQEPSANIGFFLHIPFPSSDHFTHLPEAKKLLSGMLGADLLGFHTPSYVRNFGDTCSNADLGVVGEEQIILPNRVARIADFPMGIDYKKYSSAAKSKAVKAAVQRYRKKYRGMKVIAAVDRMDPSKGLVERLRAYRTFLKQNPKLHGKVIFSMIAAPSRTEIEAYKQLSDRLDKIVADINGAYGTKKWQPVDYINTAQPFEEVAALFQVADVAFIAPLRDGMNLAAKEFIASNQGGGALILSETAGAAEELRAALIVSPHRPHTYVEALQQSLNMPKVELNIRLRKMKKHIATNSVQTWAKNFVDNLQPPVPRNIIRTRSINKRLEADLKEAYTSAKKRLLLLDYDGSLVPFSRDYTDAKPPRSVLHLLETLQQDKCNEIVIVSGRSSRDLERWFGHMKISLVAEHGAAVKKAGNKRWRTVDKQESRWKRAIEPILLEYCEKTPKSHVEVKAHSLVWHYRASPAYYAQKYAVTIKKVLKPYLKTFGLAIYQGNKILEVKDPHINKGQAIESWLKPAADFVLVIGDDFTDEDMFHAVPASAWSIKVGRGSTDARYRVQSSDEVRKLLSRLTKQSAGSAGKSVSLFRQRVFSR